MKNIKLALLITIFFLGLVLRLFQVSSVPTSLYWDEVAIGYNAHSIAQTAKDEYGQFLPLLFRSFDDYKFPGQVYLTSPFVKVFGLNELSVRLPAVILGSLSILGLYFLTREIFPRQKKLPLVAALLLSISPWHIQFTRASFEAGSAFTLILFGLGFIWKYFRHEQIKNYFLGVFFLVLSTYFYRSALVVTPLLLFLSVFLNYKLNLRKYLKLVLPTFLFVVFSLPIYLSSLFGPGSSRSEQVGIARQVFDQSVENSIKISQSNNSFISKVIYNRRILYVRQFFANYLESVNFNFLFVYGDLFRRHRVEGMGVLYLWELITVLVGLGFVFLRRNKENLFLLFGILICFLPAAISYPVPHALRSLNAACFFAVISAIGLVKIVSFCKQKLGKRISQIAIIFVALMIGVFVNYYQHQYFTVNAENSSYYWGDPFKQMVLYVNSVSNQYEKIIVSGTNWKPYMYFLFFSQTNPADFQKLGNSYEYRKFWYSSPDWDIANSDRKIKNVDLFEIANGSKTLVVLNEEEYRSKELQLSLIKVISAKSGQKAFYVAKLREDLQRK